MGRRASWRFLVLLLVWVMILFSPLPTHADDSDSSNVTTYGRRNGGGIFRRIRARRQGRKSGRRRFGPGNRNPSFDQDDENGGDDSVDEDDEDGDKDSDNDNDDEDQDQDNDSPRRVRPGFRRRQRPGQRPRHKQRDDEDSDNDDGDKKPSKKRPKAPSDQQKPAEQPQQPAQPAQPQQPAGPTPMPVPPPVLEGESPFASPFQQVQFQQVPPAPNQQPIISHANGCQCQPGQCGPGRCPPGCNCTPKSVEVKRRRRRPGPKDLNPAGVNGNPSFQYKISSGGPSGYMCQGTLNAVKDNTCFIGTAGHCVHDLMRSHSARLSFASQDFGQNLGVSVFLNPRYQAINDPANDSALIVLKGKSCSAAASSMPVVPLSEVPPRSGSRVFWASGWLKHLFKGRVNKNYRKDKTGIDVTTGAGVRQGDSGGGFFTKVKGVLMQVGFLSTGDGSLYSKVANYSSHTAVTWLKKKITAMGGNPDPAPPEPPPQPAQPAVPAGDVPAIAANDTPS